MRRRIGAGFVWGVLAALVCVLAAAPGGEAISPSGNGTGAVSGRIYIDFDGNEMFDGFDAPLESIGVEFFSGPETDENGIYTIEDLQPGPYTVQIGPGPCADFLMNDWLGVYVLGFCPVQQLPTAEVEIVAGMTVNADIPLPAFNGSANARLWLDGEAAPESTPVSVLVDGSVCRDGEADLMQSQAHVQFSEFFVEVPANEPECQGEEVALDVDGDVLHTWTWDEFWQAEWTDWWYEGDYFSRLNLSEPPIFGVFGTVDEAAARSLQTAGAPFGDIRAVIDGQLCSEPRPVDGDTFYGLIVVNGALEPRCGNPEAVVEFCVGDELADDGFERLWKAAYGEHAELTLDGTTCPPLHTVDADCDGDGDAVDALGILTLVAGLEPISDCWNPGDTDCDGDRDATDALVVLRDVAGLDPGIPAGCHSFVIG